MLQLHTLPTTLTALLDMTRPCFTAPSFRTFAALAAGMIAQPGRRTVTGMLIGAGLSRLWHHSRAHWFFSAARWCPDQLGLAVLGLVTTLLLPTGAPVVVAVDDTLFHRSGRKVYAAAWCHDGAARTPKGAKANAVAWGNCWVVAAVVVALPMLSRPVALPVAWALWTKGGPPKQVLACRLISRITQACPGRAVHAVADGWYAGADGAPGAAQGATRARGLPDGVTLTSRPRANAVFDHIAVPTPRPPGQRGGRPRRIGERIGTAAALAAHPDTVWTTTTVHRYGRTDTIETAEQHLLWYGVYRSRTVRLILIRELPQPGSRTKTGYQLALITTDLASDAAAIVERYAARWAIEVAFEDAKQTTGVGQARNRTRQAVERTVPFGLTVQTLTVIWYTQHGHHPDITATRRAQAPWYQTKTQPAYHDMIIKLRRTLIAARFLQGKARKPSPEETLAVQLAWAEAAA
jgi:hypothetical protein